ncbi:hypothetical protein [Bacillus sp. B15-48]|uniref:hypothetical protein n=1 Tax=Bacillus sp. B15-48 TaxID=1548601 RepID=UPI00193FC414|nr:hypothetical protein [Bacillus sp. B15-48]MBM4763295.1 hypothetical protein [Bacillus sp. B15-48]
MKRKLIGALIILLSLNIFAGQSSAEEVNKTNLEAVTLSLLHPTVVKALKKHYGGVTQFENVSLVSIHSRQLPADLKDDSAFKSPASIFDITLLLETILGDGKKEKVKIVLSNEFSNGYDVVTFEVIK